MLDMILYHSEFITLCETGNLYDAADRLFISESNLMKHMRNLEDAVEHKIFQKCSNHVELTEFGTMYLAYAYKYKALDKEVSQKIAEYDSRNKSVVKIAVSRSMNCDHIVNMLSDHFADRHPEYSISPGEFSRTVNLHKTFEMGYELSFAIGSSPTDVNYHTYQWSTDRLIAILPLNHPLANRKSLSLTELSSDKFILFPEGTFLNHYCLSLCEKAGFKPMVDFTIHGTRNLVELVDAGLGVSLTTSSDALTIKKHNVAMVEIDPVPLVYLNLYHRKDVPLSKPAQCFLDFAIDIHENHSDDIPYQGPEGEVGNVYFK
ncbi:MAG: LysR family transcriptional regulator [Pseudobutyrivibrio ruminis]|nr:LysR family transcriptional regulator [Pseudobutyrivibrio ruminis]